MKKEGYDKEGLWADTRFTGICALICALGMLTMSALPSAFFALGLAVTGWLAIWYGSTLLSLKFSGPLRKFLQCMVSLIIPVLVSTFLLQDIEKISLVSFEHVATFWMIVPITVLVCIGRASAKTMDIDQPQRVLMGLATAVCVLVLMKAFGIYSIREGYDESVFVVEKSMGRFTRETGQALVSFWLFLAFAWAPVLWHLMRHAQFRRTKDL